MTKVRLTDKKVEEVAKYICGADVLPLIRKLRGKENVSEFKLAEALKDDIKRVRNTLYRLYGTNLVEFTRKKDKKKGWYIYYWTFKPDQIKFLYRKIKLEELDKLKDFVKAERTQQFFVCVNECTRMDFEQAINFEYRCPECGQLRVQEGHENKYKDTANQIIALEKEIDKL